MLSLKLLFDNCVIKKKYPIGKLPSLTDVSSKGKNHYDHNLMIIL